MFQLTVGCDPELFLRKDNSFLSAFGIVKGNKQNPHKLLKGAVQVDGMALEFNIEPAKNVYEFVDNISTVLSEIRKSIDKSIEFDMSSTAHLTEEYLLSRQYEELELGCEPDYNAYTGEENEAPEREKPMRTAGGHVHVGLGMDVPRGPEADATVQRMVKLMDIFLGVPSVLLDKDKDRRSMYGKAGAFRYKSYGFEYRSLSNFWIRDKELMAWVFRNTELAIASLDKYGELVDKIDAESIINNSDTDSARQVVEAFGIPMP